MMAGNARNRTRAFADVVTIDAWHSSFAEGQAKVSLHADVVFGTARLGGEPESEIRFKLSVKRAELIVIAAETEPVRIDKMSISRDAPKLIGEETKTLREGASIKSAAKVGLGVASDCIEANVGLHAAAEVTRDENTKTVITSKFSNMIVTQSMTENRDYRWIIECRPGEILDGRPWDAIKNPRMSIIDTRRKGASVLPPAIRLEVRCRKEDLSINNIQIKDNNIWKRVRTKMGFSNRLLAAEAYIKQQIADEGLSTRNFEDKFGEVVLATTIADESN